MQRDHGEKIKWHKWGDLKHTDINVIGVSRREADEGSGEVLK